MTNTNNSKKLKVVGLDNRYQTVETRYINAMFRYLVATHYVAKSCDDDMETYMDWLTNLDKKAFIKFEMWKIERGELKDEKTQNE
jgi:hypothetical protein